MSWPTPGQLAGWAALVGLLWLFGGPVGLAAACAFVVYDLVRAPSPRDLLVGSALLLGLTPLAVLARGLPAEQEIDTTFVLGNPVAHHLAGAGVALLVLGVLREARSDR